MAMESKIVSASSVTFGGLLDGLWDNVNDTIQQTIDGMQNAGVELLIETGKQIELAIENGKTAYKDCLDDTIEKANQAAKEFFGQLKPMVQRFQNKVIDEMTDLKLEAQQITNTLPFTNKMPQLTTISPRYFVIGDVDKVSRITFKGNFPWSATKGYEPKLSFKDKECFIFNTTTQELVFDIPNSVFNKDNKEQFSCESGTLELFGDDGWIFSHKVESVYKIGIGALPQIAGTVVVDYIDKETERVTQPKSSPTFFFDGNDYYPDHWHLVPQEIYPDADWKVDVTSPPVLNTEHVHGTHQQWIDSVTQDKIIVMVKLYCKDGHDIGKVRIRVDFTQWQYKSTENHRTETFQVNWKDDELLQPKPHEDIDWASFTAFDGSVQKFASPDISDRSVLKISGEGNGVWKIWAEPPKDGQAKKKLSDVKEVKLNTVNSASSNVSDRNVLTSSAQVKKGSEVKLTTTNKA